MDCKKGSVFNLGLKGYDDTFFQIRKVDRKREGTKEKEKKKEMREKERRKREKEKK